MRRRRPRRLAAPTKSGRLCNLGYTTRVPRGAQHHGKRRSAEGSMRYAMSLAKVALALGLPFIVAYCASVPGAPDLRCQFGRQAQQRRSHGTVAPARDRPVSGHRCESGTAAPGSADHLHRRWVASRRNGVVRCGPRSTVSTRAMRTRPCFNKISNPRPILRAQDAFNAATYLRTLPTIQPDHIGIIGFSSGGTTALYTALASGAPTDSGGRPFQGGGRRPSGMPSQGVWRA